MEPEASSRILILSAWEPEQRLLRNVLHGASAGSASPLGELESARAATWREKYGVSELSQLGRDVAFACLGVGVFQALEFLCDWLRDGPAVSKNPPTLCFTGTGGVVGKRFINPFAARVSAVCWYDPRVLTGHAYLPPQMEREWVFWSEVGADEGTVSLTCLGTFGITRSTAAQDAALTALKERLGLDQAADFAENLELYAVARAAARYGLKWRAHLGVSNETGPLAHAQWKSHHIPASCLAQEQLLEALMRTRGPAQRPEIKA